MLRICEPTTIHSKSKGFCRKNTGFFCQFQAQTSISNKFIFFVNLQKPKCQFQMSHQRYSAHFSQKTTIIALDVSLKFSCLCPVINCTCLWHCPTWVWPLLHVRSQRPSGGMSFCFRWAADNGLQRQRSCLRRRRWSNDKSPSGRGRQRSSGAS